MNRLAAYDKDEFEKLYDRLSQQKKPAVFCVLANDSVLQREIAESISFRFPNGETQIINFEDMPSDYRFSVPNLCSMLDQGGRLSILTNFQLSRGELSEEVCISILNQCLTELADLPYILVFIMTHHFHVQLVRHAPGFDKLFQYYANFTDPNDYSGAKPKEQEAAPLEYTDSNRELLKYYLEKYNLLNDRETVRAFNILLKILYFNASVGVLHYTETRRYYASFTDLLTRYRDEVKESANEIAQVFFEQGEYELALEWYQIELVASEKTNGLDHPSIATIYNNIATVYTYKNNYARALELHRKALSIREKKLVADHPALATSYNNVAMNYFKLKEYFKSLLWYQKALAIFEKRVGAFHPATAAAYNNIAQIYSELSNYVEALRWYQKALDVDEKVMGKEHPFTANTYNNIAAIHAKIGDVDKALEWFQKALDIRKNTFGPDHPATLVTIENIAALSTKKDSDMAH